MTFDEARRVLGLDLRADSQAIRNAYLAGVKAHRPERDPDGFQRVRAAYELLRHLGAPSGEASAIERESVGSLTVAVATQLPVDADPAAFAHAVDLPEQFLQELDDPGSEQPDEEDHAGTEEAWHTLAESYLKRGHADTAAALITNALERAQRDAFAPRPPRFYVTDLALGLLECGERTHAQHVLERAALVYADERPGAMFVVGQEMAGELGRIAASLPNEIVTAFARSVREHEPAHAESALELHALQDKGSARALTKLLKRQAPLLFQSYGHSLAGPRRGNSTLWTQERPWYAHFWLPWLVIGVLRVFMPSACNEHRAPPKPSAARSAASSQAEPEWLRALCAPDDPGPATCAAARAFGQAKTCGEAAGALEAIDRASDERAKKLELSARSEDAVLYLHDWFQKSCRPVRNATGAKP